MKNSILLIIFILWIHNVSAQNFDLKHDHSNLLVSNLDSSAAFYKKILQLKELPTPWGVNPAVRFFKIGNNRQIHMVQVDSREISKNKILHLTFNVKDFDKYLTFLKTQGIKYSNFSGAIGEIQVRPDGIRQIYFQDPDGNWIEVNDASY